jgi:hypothetical protein
VQKLEDVRILPAPIPWSLGTASKGASASAYGFDSPHSVPSTERGEARLAGSWRGLLSDPYARQALAELAHLYVTYGETRVIALFGTVEAVRPD